MPVPTAVRAYVLLLAAVAALGTAASLAVTSAAGTWQFWAHTAALATVFVVCDSMTTAHSRVHLSLSFVAGLATVLLLGPAAAGVVGMLGAAEIARDRAPVKRLFNGAQFALAGLAAGWVYDGLGGTALLDGSGGRLVGATCAVVAVYYLVNTALFAVVIALLERLPVSRVFWGGISWASLSYLAHGLLGLGMAVLWHISVVAGLLVLIPILVARWTFAQYAAEQQAYEATVAALCQAVEVKDTYTRGHSERVSLGSVMVARALDMREDRVVAIRYAGMLHDVGKLGVPTRVLQKTGSLTFDEFEAIKMHPVRGYDLLCDIEFLDEALRGIIHHHERVDGLGYPMGLRGDDIPEFARIIAVADALDAMTSTRSYRGARSVAEALEEIERCKGAQFDPRMVEALVRAVADQGWERPEPPAVEAPAGDVTAYDHDDVRSAR